MTLVAPHNSDSSLEQPSESAELATNQNHVCDVTIVVEGFETPCSRKLLSEASPVFRAMFALNMRERREQVVQLPGCHILGWTTTYALISKDPGANLTERNVMYALDTAHMYNFEAVLDQCERFLIGSIKMSSWFHLYMCAMEYLLSKLQVQTFEYVCLNIRKVSRSPWFAQISTEMLRRILGSFRLTIYSEFDVIEAILFWCGKDADSSRTTSTLSLMESVRFGTLDLLTLLNVQFSLQRYNLLGGPNKPCGEICERYLCKAYEFARDVHIAQSALAAVPSEEFYRFRSNYSLMFTLRFSLGLNSINYASRGPFVLYCSAQWGLQRTGKWSVRLLRFGPTLDASHAIDVDFFVVNRATHAEICRYRGYCVPFKCSERDMRSSVYVEYQFEAKDILKGFADNPVMYDLFATVRIRPLSQPLV